MARPRVWLITGASSGFGRLLTEFVLSQGDIAVATLRKPEVLKELSAKYSEDKLLVLKLDVINQAEIDHAFTRTKEVYGRLDVVFNNAGYVVAGDAETTSINGARELFEVNFWGAVNVSRAAIKFLRETNEPGRGGVLLQNSSISGISGYPGLAFYSASKHALEGFSESLAREVLPEWNIKICIISPGAFQTSVVTNAIFQPVNLAYDGKTEVSTLVNNMSSGEFEFPGDAAKFAKAIFSLVEDGSMPLHLPIGQDSLAEARKKVEALGEDISKATPWSADLLRKDVQVTLAA